MQEANGGLNGRGCVHVFDAAGTLVRTIDDPATTTGSQFGSPLAEFDGALVVGAPLKANSTGAVFIFRLN